MANAIIKFVKSVCVQKAVYWGNPQESGYGGYTFDDPVEIWCRWDDKVQVVTDDQGKEVVSNAEVMVLRDLDEEGMLLLGTLDDLDSDALDTNPAEIKEAREIKRFHKTPLFQSSTEFVRKAFLS